MKVPGSSPPISQAIQTQQNRLHDLRQSRTKPPELGYSSVIDTPTPKSVDEWKRILAEKRALLAKAATSQSISTVLLGKPEQSPQKINNLPTALSPASKTPTSSTALVPTTFRVTPEIRAIGESLGSVLEKLLSFPPRRIESSAPVIPPSTELTVPAPERDRSLDHLTFPGQETGGDEAGMTDAPVSAVWEPIFPRVENLNHITFPPEKPKALLLERQDKNQKK